MAKNDKNAVVRIALMDRLKMQQLNKEQSCRDRSHGGSAVLALHV